MDRSQDAAATLTLQPGHERLLNYTTLMSAVLEVDGVTAAVQLANAATSHRFTGVFRFDKDWLTNLYLCDSVSGAVTVAPATPLNDTYCVHILQTGHAFTVLDSLQDERLAGHPKRADVRSYCGAPLLNQQGEVAGTVCHFDPEPGKMSPSDFEQVHIAAALLQHSVLREGPPSNAPEDAPKGSSNSPPARPSE